MRTGNLGKRFPTDKHARLHFNFRLNYINQIAKELMRDASPKRRKNAGVSCARAHRAQIKLSRSQVEAKIPDYKYTSHLRP